ncbi:MAG: hypothetical protein KDI74_15195 [Gammaproteobacteria bacterium]|nr:hypothetical protein [Gammaproteobacteria bacterium]HXK57373.1 hypothetical protein [Gammaproteobacteria bacterium]
MSERPFPGILSRLSLLLMVFSFNVIAGPDTNERIALAAEHMVRMQLDSGLFIYEHDFLSGADSSRNNIVRQAGAAFALAEYFQYSKKAVARKAVDRARKAFERNAVEWREGKLLALDGKREQAKAGATALAVLAALLSADDDQEPGSDRQLLAWLKGLVSLQQQNGGFASRPGSDLQSAYSNGEIWLALAVLRDKRGDDMDAHLFRALQRADNRFLQFYSANPDIGFFHWGMMAAATRYWSTRETRFSRFIAEQTKLFLMELRPKTSHKSNSCYSVEGLLAGLAVLEAEKGYDELSRQVSLRVRREMDKNLRLQILPDQKRIRFSGNRHLKSPELAQYAGAFLNGKYRPQTRIDATQHCLSAMIKDQARRKEPAAGSQ